MNEESARAFAQIDDALANSLNVGFIVLRTAVDTGNVDWIRAEVVLLHNLPSLIGDRNLVRHRFFLDQERAFYLEWLDQNGTNEMKSRMRTYHEPAWRELETAVAAADRLAESNS